MTEKLVERRGRFFVQELDEDELAQKCRHYSLFNRTYVHDFPIESTAFENDTLFGPRNIPFVLDCEKNQWINFNQIWNNFSDNIKNEKEDMSIIFKFGGVDHYPSSEYEYTPIQDVNINYYSTDKETNEDHSVWFNNVDLKNKQREKEYDELAHSGNFVINADESFQDEGEIFDSTFAEIENVKDKL